MTPGNLLALRSEHRVKLHTTLTAFWGKAWRTCFVLSLMFLFVMPVYSLLTDPPKDIDVIYIGLLILQLAVAIYCIVVSSKKSAANIALVHWFYIALSMAYIPICKEILGLPTWLISYTSDRNYSHAKQLTALMTLCWSVSFALAYRLGINGIDRAAIIPKPLRFSNVLQRSLLLSFVAVIICFALWPSKLFSRQGKADIDTTLFGVCFEAFRIVPAACLAVILRRTRPFGREIFLVGALVLVALLLNFPVGAARFWFGMVLTGTLFSMPAFSRAKGLGYVCALLLSFAFIMPYLSRTRYTTAGDLSKVKLEIHDFRTGVIAGDYDAMEMSQAAVSYVDRFGPMNGRQMLSNVLAFVPRRSWEFKAQPGGGTVALGFGHSFINLSMPPFAESYLDAGLFGTVLCGLVFGFLVGRTDAKYSFGSGGHIRPAFYPFLVAGTMFIIRGPLMSTWTRVAFACVSVAFIEWVLLLRASEKASLVGQRVKVNENPTRY